MVSTVKNGMDRLRKENRPRRHTRRVEKEKDYAGRTFPVLGAIFARQLYSNRRLKLPAYFRSFHQPRLDNILEQTNRMCHPCMKGDFNAQIFDLYFTIYSRAVNSQDYATLESCLAWIVELKLLRNCLIKMLQ